MADENRRRPQTEGQWGPTTQVGHDQPGWLPPGAPTATEHAAPPGSLPPPSQPYAPPASTPTQQHPTQTYQQPSETYRQPTETEAYRQPTETYRQPTEATAIPPAAPPSATAAPTTETVPPRGAPTPPDPFDPDLQPGPTAGVVPPPAPLTDELPLHKRFARRVRRGDQRDALRDAARTVEAKVPADFRIAIGTGVLAIASAVVQQALFPVSSASTTTKLIGYGLALAFLVLGLVAVRSLANELARVSTAKGGKTAAQAIRVTTLLVGYLLVILVTLGIIDVRLGNLLVGGALTGVVIGIAAQQALGNVFAGLVLLFSRPYVPGERIRVNSGAIGGPHDGVVVSVGLTYTVLLTSYGPLNLPNSQLLASAIGPQPPDDDDPGQDATVTDDPDDGPAAPRSQGGAGAPSTNP